METISYHRLIPATITAVIILLFASVKAVGCVSARHSKTHGKTVMEHARILIVKIQTYLLTQINVFIAGGYYVFSREGLEIDTAISTVYFVLNSNGMYELQSVAAGVPLHIVRNSNGDDIASNCAVYKLYVMTQSGMTEIENDGFSIVTEDSKRYVEASIYAIIHYTVLLCMVALIIIVASS